MYPSMLSRGPDVEIEPYYCLPVGTVPPGGGGGANGHVAVAGQPGVVGGNVNQVVGVGPAAWSQPTSPTPINRGFGGPLSPTHGGPANLPGCHRLTYPKKNDDVHGSAASLLSGGSSLYGSAEERQANEIRRLKRELTDARDQVMSLSSQLSTNSTSGARVSNYCLDGFKKLMLFQCHLLSLDFKPDYDIRDMNACCSKPCTVEQVAFLFCAKTSN